MTRRRRASRRRRLPHGQDMLKRRETGSFKPDSDTGPDSLTPGYGRRNTDLRHQLFLTWLGSRHRISICNNLQYFFFSSVYEWIFAYLMAITSVLFLVELLTVYLQMDSFSFFSIGRYLDLWKSSQHQSLDDVAMPTTYCKSVGIWD